MNKNSLILDIKNDLNSIKKQIDVALAKLAVLESMVELDNKLGIRNEELGIGEEGLGISRVQPEITSNASSEELGIKEDPESELKVGGVVEIEPEIEITPNSSLLTPNCETPATFRNLMSVISLGDKFRFRHDLFSDSDDLFRDTIEILNTIEKFTEAVDYLDEKFNWDPEDATVVYFYDIIKPKFNN